MNPLHLGTNVARGTQICVILARNGFLEFLEQIEAPSSWISRLIPMRQEHLNLWQRIRVTAEELGPTFVKFAQVLSTRADVLPEPLIEELKRLRDQVAPVPWEEIRPGLERELKGSVDEVFAEFNRTPIAAGSIAQVYRAKLRTGEEVVVKAQRPNLRKQMTADLEIIHWFSVKMQLHLPELQAYDLPAIVEEARENMLRELDFSIEARNSLYFNAVNPFPEDVYSPRVYEELSTKRVLIFDWVDGVPPPQAQAVVPPEARHRLAMAGGRSVFHQIIISGFFHGDPHTGNLLVTRDQRLCLIDWGVAGQLTRNMRYFLADLFQGIREQNAEKVVQVALANAMTKRRVDPVRLEKEVSIMLRKYASDDAARDMGRVMLDLLYVFGSNGIRLARDYSLLAKAVISIEEAGKTLDPNFDIREISDPFLRQLALERWHPRTLLNNLYWDWRVMLRQVRELPGTVSRLLRNLEEGEASINFVHHGLDGLRTSLEDGVNRLVLAIIIAATLLSCSMIVSRVSPESLEQFPYRFAKWGFYGAMVLGVWLLFETIRSHRRK